MPLFFFLSGLFIERSASREASGFITSKLRTIVYPYVLWSILQGAAQTVLSGVANHKASLLEIVTALPIKPFAHFWFLYALFFCSIMYLVLYKAGLRRWAIVVLGGIFYATTDLFGLGSWDGGYMLRKNFLYLAAGAVASKALCENGPRLRTSGLIMSAIGCFSLLLVEAQTHLAGTITLAQPIIAGLGITGTLAMAFIGSRSGRHGLMTYLGAASLPIYLAHVLGSAAARVALQKIAHINTLWVHLLAGVVLGIAFPVGLHWAAEKLRMPYLFTLPSAPRRKVRTQAVTAQGPVQKP